jgi:hypothetical protein
MTLHQAGVQMGGVQLCHVCGVSLVERRPTEISNPDIEPWLMQPGELKKAVQDIVRPTVFFQPGTLVMDTPDGCVSVTWSTSGEMLCNGEILPFLVWGWL